MTHPRLYEINNYETGKAETVDLDKFPDGQEVRKYLPVGNPDLDHASDHWYAFFHVLRRDGHDPLSAYLGTILAYLTATSHPDPL